MKNLLRSFGAALGAGIFGVMLVFSAADSASMLRGGTRLERATHLVAIAPPAQRVGSGLRTGRRDSPRRLRPLSPAATRRATRWPALLASRATTVAANVRCRSTVVVCGYRATAPPGCSA